ncbi:odorant receptor 175 [Nasonia vitripennis]|uniref:Odorant receptor n=1 Tax=Nasonia vitripennis TaxID=7425 RepID=A0A7M6W8I7_NASVI|nr:odorant receptor 175 [Nasonia vitripennis]
MDIFDGAYYKSCKWFLSTLGLWPYQTDNRKRISAVIFFVVNISLAIPTLWLKSFTVTFENTVSVMFAIGCCAKYVVTYTSSQRVRNKADELVRLFKQIASDWQRITDTTELSILTKYSEKGKFLITFYQVYVWFGWTVYTLMPFIPYFLDKVSPLNESRPLLMPFYADYIVFDQADYHYTSCFHIAFVYISSALLFCGVDATFVMSVQHTCGLFAIICHRLEGEKIKKESEYAQNVMKTLSEEELREVVIFHNNCITCSGLLEDSFNLSFLILNSMSVLGLALSGVYFIYIYEDYYKFVRIMAFFVGLIIHLLYLNWVGQKIIDSSEDVFLAAYCSKWYVISTSARAFIKIIMVRALEPCRLTAGGLSTLCMESFGILIKTSVSYFTVFLSVA